MMTHQILLVINGLLLGVLILSLYFVVRNRTQAHRAQVNLKDVCKELEISKDQVSRYRDRTDRAESELKNACEQARLAHDDLKKSEDRKNQAERNLKQKQDSLKKLENICKRLEHDLADARRLVDLYSEQKQGTREQSENTRDRAESESEPIWSIEARKEFAKEFLDSLDIFELGLTHASKQDSAQIDGIVDGMALALDKLKGAVGKIGIEIVDPKGKSFDPKVHRAIGTQEREGVATGVVLSAARKGCLFDGQIMRFADVIIAK